MHSPRTLLLSAVAGGVAIGLLGGAQVNTTMNPGPEAPFRWAQPFTAPTQSMQFAASVPLELDVPADFQIRTAAIEGDPVRAEVADLRPAQPQWASLGLAQYRVEQPVPLPDERGDAGWDAASRAHAAALDAAARIDRATALSATDMAEEIDRPEPLVTPRPGSEDPEADGPAPSDRAA